MAPLRYFDSPVMIRRTTKRAKFPIYFNPVSLHLTFEEVLIPCKAIVVAPDENAAWMAVEQIFTPAQIKKRFVHFWEQKWQQRLEEFGKSYGFRRTDE